MGKLSSSNNEIIRKWKKNFAGKLLDSKNAFGIKHKRVFEPKRPKITERSTYGEIDRLGVIMSAGEMFTHKGVGGNGNRSAKPWYNQVAEVEVGKLADEVMINTGNIVASHIID